MQATSASSTEDLLTRAGQHLASGEAALAGMLCQQIVAAVPTCAAAWDLLGMVHLRANWLATALDYFSRAVLHAPELPAHRSHRGAVLRMLGKYADAETEFREAARLDPDRASAHSNLGTALTDLRRFDEAEACCRRALALRPDYLEALNNLANALRELGRTGEAESCYRRALELKPDDAATHYNLGTLHGDLGQFAEAESCYGRSLELKPDNAEGHINLALLWLLTGEWERGLVEHEWRWRVRGVRRPTYPQPAWDGSSLAGHTILLHAEQGLGDTLHFIRYARQVKARGAAVLFHCPRQLVDLVCTCPGMDQVLPLEADPPAFDVHAPLLSLPRLFGTTPQAIPTQPPYLAAEPQRVEQWREQLALVPGFRVGIVWQGNPTHRKDRQRSVPLAQFEPLASVPGVSLLSLQVGEARTHVAACSRPLVAMDCGAEFDLTSFQDAAAVLMNVDLLITVDTALAHLAGALGVPVWAALPFVPDWRWLLDGEETPWYPTMRLFRQRSLGDWDDVFARMTRELAVLSGRISTPAAPEFDLVPSH